MEKTKIFVLFMACIMMLTVFTGCSPDEKDNVMTNETTNGETASDSAGEKVDNTVIDMTGREIKLDLPADKVVALTASDCEIIYALGAGSTIAGRGEYCDYPKEVSDIPSVQSGSETNIEQIIALGPQVVLMSAMAQTTEQIAALENAEKNSTDALNLKHEYEEQIRAARNEADKIINNARGKAEKEYDAMLNSAKKDAAIVMEKARAEIGSLAKNEKDVLSYIAFPQIAESFLKKREEKASIKVAYSIRKV
jgi:iron complex transport system substrate-binding protein